MAVEYFLFSSVYTIHSDLPAIIYRPLFFNNAFVEILISAYTYLHTILKIKFLIFLCHLRNVLLL